MGVGNTGNDKSGDDKTGNNGDKTRGGAVGTVLIENKRVRVTRWDFPEKGDCTGWHRHGHDYVVVPLFDGDLRIDQGDEVVTSSLTTGGSYFRKAGVEHNVCNGNGFACSFVEVELLEPSPVR